LEFIAKSRSFIDLRETVLSHGWVNLAPWKWDNEQGILQRPERLSIGQKVYVEVTQMSSKELRVRANLSEGIDGTEELDGVVRRWLSLDWNPKPAISHVNNFSPDIARFIRIGGGRFLRSSTFYEDFVKTVCTMNASWAFTQKATSRLIEEIGDGIFPSPIEIINTGQDFLQKKIRMGYRSKVLFQATDRLLKEGLIYENGKGNEKKINYNNLISLWGIGQYAAAHLMVLLQDFSRIPIDSEVIRYCRKTYGIAEDEIAQYFSKWGKYSFLGYKLDRIISRTNWIGD